MIPAISGLQLPLTDPVLKFLVILLVILVIPIVSDKIRIPHLLGMILAGIIIGPSGFNLISRDSSIILSGTAGLLYIMFLAGLEIDMNYFRKNAGKGLVLGLYGFIIPMVLGTLACMYVLNFSVVTSVLLASMFASHTLITYPIVSKFGISKNRAVNVSVGSTLITNVLALTVLAAIVGFTRGELNNAFWVKLLLSFIAFSSVIIFLFPIISRWFFKRYSDSVSQYIFVLVLVFFGAVLSGFAGIEAIIGAFMAGLALNRLIPRTSPLMNRIGFVGNAIFIPFFLIGVGMLIDYRAFLSINTLFVALVMSVTATAAKFISAWLAQKSFRFSRDERMLIFGLTNSQAAATLAAVMVGYNIITGYNENGEPIRLLHDSILNGTIVMILATCTIASFTTQRNAQKIALSELSDEESYENTERILIPVSNPNTIDELVNLCTILKSKRNRDGLYALNVIKEDKGGPEAEQKAGRLLEKATVAASAVDIRMKTTLRYDLNLANGITHFIKENNITDLILGIHVKGDVSDSFLGNLTEDILSKSNFTTYIYHPFQPISTIRRHFVVIPENAENEPGFSFWLAKIWNIAHNTGARMTFYSSGKTNEILQEVNLKHPIDSEFNLFDDWNQFPDLTRQIRNDDNIIIILSRKNQVTYQAVMADISTTLERFLPKNNFLIIYPIQSFSVLEEKTDLTNSSLLEAIERVDLIGKTIAGIFRKN